MICPQCNFEQADQNVECPRCGVVFEKYQRQQNLIAATNAAKIENGHEITETGSSIKDLFFFVPPETNPFYFFGRVLIFLILLIWGWKFILTPMESNYTGASFLHLVNLPFHEAGHIVFRLFGRFMASLGGSLGQLLMPFICLLAFLITSKNIFGASVSLWWFGQNFMDLALYINDARAGRLMLLGGNTGSNTPYGFHDWEYILGELGLLRYDHTLANVAFTIGIVMMLLSFGWAGYVLFRQYKNLDLK
jgi:hypothetical protein